MRERLSMLAASISNEKGESTMTEVNPVLVRYRRDRANAFEQPGAPGVLDHLSVRAR